MKSVSRFEANLLRILSFFLGRAPYEQVQPLLDGKRDRPKCLSADAVGLVQDALAKGCTLLLAQRGGWRHERFLRGDRKMGQEKAVDGRLWERTKPEELGLRFSKNTLDFLLWITATKPTEASDAWKPVEKRFTVSDYWLFHLAHEALRGSPAGAALAQRWPFHTNALSWLLYPGDFTQTPVDTSPDLSVWTKELGSCVVEVLQEELAERWVQTEVGKAQITDWQRMRLLGQAQERILDAFLNCCETSGRVDLARWVVVALSDIVTDQALPGMWVGGLKHGGQRLQERAETYRAATALLRQTARLCDWTTRARSAGYFDDDYAASQLWLRDWERLEGDLLHERAQGIIRQLDPLRQAEGQS